MLLRAPHVQGRPHGLKGRRAGAAGWDRILAPRNPLTDFGIPYVTAIWGDDPNLGATDGAALENITVSPDASESAVLTQGTAASRPTWTQFDANFNNRGAFSFDGTDDYVQSASDWGTAQAAAQVISVQRVTSLGVSGYFWDGKGLGARSYMRMTSGNLYVYGAAGTSVTTDDYVDTNPHLVTLLQTASTAAFAIDGATVHTAATADVNWNGLTLGAAGNGTGPRAIDFAFFAVIPATFWFFGGTEASRRLALLQRWLDHYYALGIY